MILKGFQQRCNKLVKVMQENGVSMEEEKMILGHSDPVSCLPFEVFDALIAILIIGDV